MNAPLRESVPAGTFPPGSRVRKAKMRVGDAHQVGALATTVSFPLGPAPSPSSGAMCYGYFVEWDDLPGVPVFVCDEVLELVQLS